MTIEQLLDFNQGNLYPKITDIKNSYVNSENETEMGLSPFINDISAGFDSSIFRVDDNKITFVNTVIPGKIKTAETADTVAKFLTIKTGEATDQSQSFNGAEAVTVDTIYKAVIAKQTQEPLTIRYRDFTDNEQNITWNGSTDKTIDIREGISDAKFATQLKTAGGNEIKATSSKIEDILITNDKGASGHIEPPTDDVSRVLLSITRETATDGNTSYAYKWVDSTQVGGAQISKAIADTPYYVLGAAIDDIANVYANIAGKSPYFKNANLYQTSDITLKTFTEDLDVNLDNLATIKKGLFYWNNDEEKVLDLGISAQSIEPLYPQVVTETDGIKAVSYSKLSVIALAAIDKLYTRIKDLEAEVEQLKTSK